MIGCSDLLHPLSKMVRASLLQILVGGLADRDQHFQGCYWSVMRAFGGCPACMVLVSNENALRVVRGKGEEKMVVEAYDGVGGFYHRVSNGKL